MSEQKHYQYEGHVELKAKSVEEVAAEVEITGYQFLVPCRVKMKCSGKEVTSMVNVDLADQKVFSPEGKEWSEEMTDKFFSHMFEVNTLPEDFYSADDETIESADKAKREFEDIRNQQYGEVY